MRNHYAWWLALAFMVIAGSTASPFVGLAKPQTHKTAAPHKAAVPKGNIAEGKKLFDTLNCASCHSIENKGGCLAPPLDCVSVRHPDDYLMLRLGEGEEDNFIKRIGHPELMQHPRFPKKELSAVIAYLRTLPCKVPPKSNKKPTTNVGL